MKILMINVVCGIRSTGRICTDLATALEAKGHEVKIAYGREEVPQRYEKYAVRIGSDLDVRLHGINSRLFDNAGFGSRRATRKFIQWMEDYNPDVVHLHNIHGYYVNVELLFRYLKNCRKKVIWTLHDCWSFTGHCTYFDYAGCEKWKTGCAHCPQKKEYPASMGMDRSRHHFITKRELFSGLEDLTLVTPSQWLADLIAESYLNNYPVKVIHNGVDTQVFKPTKSNVLEKYHCENKKIILGVAAIWDKRKGLNSFIELNNRIGDDYRIILVGLNREQINKLPEGIIGIERTNSVQELAELYTAAYVFVNPTYEDNYPTTNIEAIACGTPVITYDTGGSSESARMFGKCVAQNDMEALIRAIECVDDIFPGEIDVDGNNTVQHYTELYEELKIRNDPIRE